MFSKHSVFIEAVITVVFGINKNSDNTRVHVQGCGEEVHSLWIMAQLPGVKCRMQQPHGVTQKILATRPAGGPLHPTPINLVRMERKVSISCSVSVIGIILVVMFYLAYLQWSAVSLEQ